jgi:hypothetical protein
MKTIAKIIKVLGGLKRLQAGHSIRLENEPYMRLCIEWVPPGVRGLCAPRGPCPWPTTASRTAT